MQLTSIFLLLLHSLNDEILLAYQTATRSILPFIIFIRSKPMRIPSVMITIRSSTVDLNSRSQLLCYCPTRIFGWQPREEVSGKYLYIIIGVFAY